MDKKKTLLHVLMDWANKKEPDLLKLDEDLVHASEASHWSLPDLKNQVGHMQQRDAIICSPLLSFVRGSFREAFAGINALIVGV